MWEELPGGGFYCRNIGKPILRKARPGPKRQIDALLLQAESALKAEGRYSGDLKEWDHAAANYAAIIGVFGGMEGRTPESIWSEMFRRAGWACHVEDGQIHLEQPGWTPPPPPPDLGFQPPLFEI